MVVESTQPAKGSLAIDISIHVRVKMFFKRHVSAQICPLLKADALTRPLSKKQAAC
jgi:hypothetical protein